MPAVEEKAVQVLKWADELSEAWVGTMTGHLIDANITSLRAAISAHQDIRAQHLTQDLHQLCKEAENELDYGY